MIREIFCNLYLAPDLVKVRVAEREVVRPQPAHSELGYVGHVEAGQEAKGKVAKLSVQLNY